MKGSYFHGQLASQGWEMAHEELRFDSQHLCKKLGVMAQAYNPSTGGAETGGLWREASQSSLTAELTFQ